MREIEVIYNLYEDEFNPPAIDEYFEFEDDTSKKLYFPKEKRNIEKGDVYLFFENGYIPVYYMVYEKEEDLYKVHKMSKWVMLASQFDVFVKVDNEDFIVEQWNSFYLYEDEIQNHYFYGRLNEDDLNLICNIVENKTPIPEDRRGLKSVFFDDEHNTFQYKFHKKESSVVRKYKYRLLAEMMIEDEPIGDAENAYIISLNQNILNQFKIQKLAAKANKSTVVKDGFAIRLDKDRSAAEIYFDEYGKKAKIKILDYEEIFEELPEMVIIPLEKSIDLDIEALAENIEIIYEIENNKKT